jgi:hypothetical protein
MTVSIPAGSVGAGTITAKNISFAPINSNGVISKYEMVEPKELAELRDDSKLLYALIDAGVEDWAGYQEAILAYRSE